MDVTGITKLATSIAETGTKQEVGMAVLKKALNIEAATGVQLINAIRSVPTVQSTANLPPNLGNRINTTA